MWLEVRVFNDVFVMSKMPRKHVKVTCNTNSICLSGLWLPIFQVRNSGHAYVNVQFW